MTRYAAFLRGINLGRRRVKMNELRSRIEELGFANVSTFIASGNVIFESDESDQRALEAAIAVHLRGALGYDVATFIRTLPELEAIVSADPFPASGPRATDPSVYVTFLDEEPGAQARTNLAALRTEEDEFAVIGREVYWLRFGRMSDSSISMPMLAKATEGVEGTMRNMNTVRKIVAKYG